MANNEDGDQIELQRVQDYVILTANVTADFIEENVPEDDISVTMQGMILSLLLRLGLFLMHKDGIQDNPKAIEIQLILQACMLGRFACEANRNGTGMLRTKDIEQLAMEGTLDMLALRDAGNLGDVSSAKDYLDSLLKEAFAGTDTSQMLAKIKPSKKPI